MTRAVPIVPIVEVKRRLDGSEARFGCELVARTASALVVRYRFRDAGGPVDSYGWFWPRRPYLCYYMVRPRTGRLVAVRFDVVRDVELGAPGEVRYRDLLLDLWVRDGVATWEDDDELAAATAAGLLTFADRARIERARRTLARGHVRIAADLRRALVALGCLAGAPARGAAASARHHREGDASQSIAQRELLRQSRT
ncbi:MAG: DUF402 domain-containing protein [Dehalococcoidia bacterium]|nr:DUF402 domain-containing protein [Dehalococcoidia bacterium]